MTRGKNIYRYPVIGVKGPKFTKYTQSISKTIELNWDLQPPNRYGYIETPQEKGRIYTKPTFDFPCFFKRAQRIDSDTRGRPHLTGMGREKCLVKGHIGIPQ